MQLSELKRFQLATITAVRPSTSASTMASPAIKSDAESDHVTLNATTLNVDTAKFDAISTRLMTLGFVPGEQVKILATGLFGRDPLLVQVGFTRFALRRTEAERIQVEELTS